MSDLIITPRKHKLTINEIKRQFPHHVVLPTIAVSGIANLHQIAKELAGAPRPYRMQRDGSDFVVFCFNTHEAGEAFAERFGGELIPAAAGKARP